MENLNIAWFLLLNAPAHPSHGMVLLAKFCAEGLIVFLPLMLIVGWLRGSQPLKGRLLQVVLACVVGLVINYLIGLGWHHPRPFVMGLGTHLVPHSPDSSFPSDHVTIMSAVAMSFCLLSRGPAMTIWAVMTLFTAWARIYVGVHFPFDMLGGMVVGIVSAWLASSLSGILVTPLLHALLCLHRKLFSRLIRAGWVTP